MDQTPPPVIPNTDSTEIQQTPNNQIGGSSNKSVTTMNPIVQGGFPDVQMFGESTTNTKK